MEKFPYEYFQNLEKLEQAIQAIKFDLTDEKLLEYKNMTPERKRSLEKLMQLVNEDGGRFCCKVLNLLSNKVE
ncbi:hypothetical protein [Enterococcus faecium]|uniref:hypothetical protein n=1 Tax=Enterococcus faecium TaxID=1352 RepID=UPI003CF2891C